MALASSPRFLVLHALRVKGFAKEDVLAELSALPVEQVLAELKTLLTEEQVLFRENRGLWQLSPAGKAHHLDLLAEDARPARAGLEAGYGQFLAINERFKELCGEWQMKPSADGNLEPNDHSDAAYDQTAVERLDGINRDAQPICTAFGEVLGRLAPYAPRLEHSLGRLHDGEQKMFTGVMCGSYHDVWMELHEDLILTLGIDRTKEGSF